MKLVKYAQTDNPIPSINRTYRFVFSDSGVDRDGDSLSANGWDLAEYKQNPVVLFSHDAQQVVGRAKNVHVENGKLVGDVEFAQTELADTIHDLVQGGYLKAVSVGFLPIDYDYSKDRKGGVDYKRQRLLEVSVVAIPSNPRALISQQPFGKLLRNARDNGIQVAPVVKWIVDKFLDEQTSPTERLIYKDTINSMSESDPSSGGYAVNDERGCGNGYEEECGFDDPETCCIHRESDIDDEEKTLMAMTKTLKAANTELTRLTNTILQLQKSSDKKETDEEALHLKLAHAHVLAAALFQVIGTKGKKRKDEDEEEEKEDDEDEREDKESDEDEREDKESDDDDQEEKRFQQIMARAKARLR